MEFVFLSILSSLLEALGDASGSITAFLGSYGYFAIFILMILESASLPIPSEVILPVIGLLAAGGTLSFPIALAVVLVAGVIGMFIDYYIAYFLGKDVVYKHAGAFRVSRESLDRFEEAFRRNGKFAVFITRMIPLVRALINFPAGFAMMEKRSFLLYSVAGALIWDVVLMSFGYYGLGSGNVGYILAGIALFAIALYAVYKIGMAKIKKM